MLSAIEIAFCKSSRLVWAVVAGVALLFVILATLLSQTYIEWAGFIYAVLWLLIPLAQRFSLGEGIREGR